MSAACVESVVLVVHDAGKMVCATCVFKWKMIAPPLNCI